MSELPIGSHQEVVSRMKAAIKAGKHWYLALLEAIRDYPEEEYLIGGEALDWISLAGRLIAETTEDAIISRESNLFIKRGKIPLKITLQEARQLIGAAKYNLYLNYLYGVTVEAALVKAVAAEIEKEFTCRGLSPPGDIKSRAFLTVYEDEKHALHALFSDETGIDADCEAQNRAEFVYWLFKYRLKKQDKEKVASDTKKALDWLNSGSPVFLRLF
jgi:hypothetical protein